MLFNKSRYDEGLIIADITPSSHICDSGIRRVKTVFIAISNGRKGISKHNSNSIAFISPHAVEIILIQLDFSRFSVVSVVLWSSSFAKCNAVWYRFDLKPTCTLNNLRYLSCIQR